MSGGCLSWLHFGDIHARAEDGWLGVHRLAALLGEFEGRIGGEVDFVFLPGDNANEGAPEQYDRVGWGGAAGGSIGAWPEHGLLGTRLGPNAYGKDW